LHVSANPGKEQDRRLGCAETDQRSDVPERTRWLSSGEKPNREWGHSDERKQYRPGEASAPPHPVGQQGMDAYPEELIADRLVLVELSANGPGVDHRQQGEDGE
jgi:hypothetical protein